MPVTSPIAHSRSPARMCASTWMPWGSASMPTASRPMPSTRGRRPVATSRRSPRSSRAVVELEDIVVAVASRGGHASAEDELDAVAAQDLVERIAKRRRLTRKQVARAFHEHDLPAEAPDGLGHLDADGPAAEHEQPARDGLHTGRLAVGPDPVELAEPRDRRDDRVGAAGDDDVIGRVAHAVDLDHARPGEPAAAAE